MNSLKGIGVTTQSNKVNSEYVAKSFNSEEDAELNNKLKENSKYQIFNLDGNDVYELAEEQIETLMRQIDNSEEDKAMDTYMTLLEDYACLYGYENVSLEDNSKEARMIRNELEAHIERKLNEGRTSNDQIKLEDYIKDNTYNEIGNKLHFWTRDNVKERDLLRGICQYE